MDTKKESNNEEIKKLVIARLQTIPNNKKISIGNKGSFDVNELIYHIKENDVIGLKIIKTQMEFLQSLKTGVLLDE